MSVASVTNMRYANGGAVVVVMKLFFFFEKQVLRHNPTYMIICVCNCCVRDGVLAKRCV